jgi:hypothetical protein
MPSGRPALRPVRYSALSGSPDLAVAGEDLLHLFPGESMPLEMEDVVIIPVEPGNDHNAIVSDCIYDALRREALQEIRCGATMLRNSRDVTTVVCFQNLGKCRWLPVTR